MITTVGWNIDDVIDGHQSHKSKRIKAIAKVLERKGRVNYKRFLAEMQFNGIRKVVAQEYLEALKDLGMIKFDKGDIVWNGKNEANERSARARDVQDRIVEYDRRMTRFDKRDLQDFQRAIMTDVTMSYLARKALFVGTPIEIMLKSGKIMNRIRGFFWLTPVLRADAEMIEEEQNQLLEWFRNYKE